MGTEAPSVGTEVRPVYSLVIPICDEEAVIPELYRRLRLLLDRLDGPAEVICVDDGSRDGSYSLLVGLHAQDFRFKVVHLARNFGHQLAITAGMDLARGQAIVIMDADLQDPPEVVLELAERWRDGYEIVYAVREQRDGETWFKRVTAAMFYRFLQRLTDVAIPADAGDFRLVDRKALDAFKAMRENSRFIRGMFSWIGFRETAIHYRRAERFAGVTKYPLRKMLRLAGDAVISFSNVPLRLGLSLGFFVSGISLLGGLAAIVLKLSGGFVVTGWASTVVIISFLGGVQLIVLGLMGEYIGRIYEEVKGRPLYIIRELHGLPAEAHTVRRGCYSSGVAPDAAAAVDQHVRQ